MDKKYKKSHFVFLTKMYRFITILLVAFILFLGFNYISARGENKCTPVKEIKMEVINPNVVFFGDSITDYYDLDKYYPDLKKVNSGISGNRTWDLKKDMYNRVYRYNPSKVILLIGINNYLYENSSTELVVNDIKDMVNQIHENLPNCEIVIQSMYPVNDDWRIKRRPDVPTVDVLTKKIIDSNVEIKKYCDDNNYKYVDMFKELSDDNCEFDKQYTNDGLHPNEKGYEKITEILKKYL